MKSHKFPLYILEHGKVDDIVGFAVLFCVCDSCRMALIAINRGRDELEVFPGSDEECISFYAKNKVSNPVGGFGRSEILGLYEFMEVVEGRNLLIGIYETEDEALFEKWHLRKRTLKLSDLSVMKNLLMRDDEVLSVAQLFDVERYSYSDRDFEETKRIIKEEYDGINVADMEMINKNFSA